MSVRPCAWTIAGGDTATAATGAAAMPNSMARSDTDVPRATRRRRIGLIPGRPSRPWWNGVVAAVRMKMSFRGPGGRQATTRGEVKGGPFRRGTQGLRSCSRGKARARNARHDEPGQVTNGALGRQRAWQSMGGGHESPEAGASPVQRSQLEPTSTDGPVPKGPIRPRWCVNTPRMGSSWPWSSRGRLRRVRQLRGPLSTTPSTKMRGRTRPAESASRALTGERCDLRPYGCRRATS